MTPPGECYAELPALARGDTQRSVLQSLARRGQDTLQGAAHGDWPRWQAALGRLPAVQKSLGFEAGLPVLGSAVEDPEALRQTLMELHPWRKGPLRLGGVDIDTEWRSDWKWARFEPHVELAGHTVLDIGCGNGYYGWRMLEAGARAVIGIDPTLVFAFQWLACRHFAGDTPNWVLPLGVEDLPVGAGSFDSVCSMGVLYHRKDPASHLRRLRSLVRPGGQVLLETLVLEGGGAEALVPQGRYARMRNVWSIPSIPTLQGWIRDVGFGDSHLLDVTRTTTQEQRSTNWMKFESLDKCLDPDEPSLTIEGYPAPVRAAMKLRA
ncbi:MAG: tRNA 5-methoxyuridine(34)/uridine 5-oxyacetic acid(34) synthase CmoB [Xanthomonadales bacterium]|nr:tRNA 5-methoxyuridine(34)/uridine 5-oxyacetic acid(34) synthase CmoB [Xanthomonadales bacterium]